MKKIKRFCLHPSDRMLKIIQRMKILVLLILVSAMQLSAEVHAQREKISVNGKDLSFEQFVKIVEGQTSYQFLYQYEQVKKLSIDKLECKSKELAEILDDIFAGTGLEYHVVGSNIIVRTANVKAGSAPAAPQSVKLKGRIMDADTKETLIGANVVIKGTAIGTVTDIDGNFEFNYSGDIRTIVVSFVGYKQIELPFVSGKPLTIYLKPDSENLDEVVIVGYGTQKKESVVGSVQMVKPGELKVPGANLSSSFAGRLAGVVAMQRSGEPGADGADFWIRGISTFNGATEPLIIIDGVQASKADLNSMDPEVIEGFSILKDATATALYGTRGANGVMIVTTKSGQNLEKAIINVRLENSFSMPTNVPSFVDGVRYMEMFNEAVNSRRTGEIVYPEAKILGTRLNKNKYVFPNVNWYDEMFRNMATNQNVNFNIRGGGKKLDYFSSVSINRESGHLKSTDDFSYSNNINVLRYVFQNNINAYISSTTKLALRINVQLRDYKGPHENTKEVFGMAMEANPVDFPVRYPVDPEFDYIKWGGKSGGKFNNGYRNPYAEMVRGYKDDFQSTVMANLKLEQKLDFVTQGLTADALFSFKNWTQTETKRYGDYNQFEVSKYNMEEDGTVSDYQLKRVGEEKKTVLTTTPSNVGDRHIYLQAMLNYNRTFGDVHNVSGMLLYNQDEFSTNNPSDLISSLPQRKQGIAGRLTYAYDYRYLIEANFGYNGSENFAAGERFGFFPSLAVGYVISRENYFQPLSHIITNLKLRGSWGLVGNDQISGERYLYLSDIDLANGDLGYTTGRDQNTTKDGPKYKRYANSKITWEVGEKWNVGLDLGLLDKFTIGFDAFKEVRDNIFMNRQSIPDFLGTNAKDKWMDLVTKIYGNLGKVENKGCDLSVDYFQAFGKDFSVSFKGTFTYATNKVLAFDQPDYQKYPNLSKVGYSIDQKLLYMADRLFVDDAEVANSPVQKIGGFVQAGDIKYIDQPDVFGVKDGVIDANDRQYTGHPTVPEIVYGFGPSFRYKKFDFSLFFQGVARTTIMIDGIHPFGTDGTRGVQTFIADNYWSADNQNIHAAYPRLSKQDNANTTEASTYWQRDGGFLKLKNAEVGFNHKFMRLYVRGTNLCTFSKFDLWDPEQGSGNGLFYPTQRVFNVGLQLTFNK